MHVCQLTGESEQPANVILTLADTLSLWKDLDYYSEGVIYTESVVRFVEVVGHFSIKSNDAFYIPNIFGSKDGRITKDQFTKVISGKVEEPPKEKSADKKDKSGKK